MKDLYRRLRPKKLSQMIGQDHAIRAIRDSGKVKNLPHAMMFSGPSGVGKTTLARILARMLKCRGGDFREINAANDRGIDMIRQIDSDMYMAPLFGDTRVWLIDEAHMLSPQAESCAFKMLEDMPDHAYFMLATTDPQKVSKPIRTRCTEYKLKSLTKQQVEGVIDSAGVVVEPEVRKKIVSLSGGSARKALVLLQQVINTPDTDDRLRVLDQVDEKKHGIDLARLLLRRAKWDSVADALRAIDGDPEKIRRIVLGYCRSIILSGGKQAPRAFDILDCFRENFFDTGSAGLVAACWEAHNVT